MIMRVVSPCCKKMLNSLLLMFQAKALQKTLELHLQQDHCGVFIFVEQDRKYTALIINEGSK